MVSLIRSAVAKREEFLVSIHMDDAVALAEEIGGVDIKQILLETAFHFEGSYFEITDSAPRLRGNAPANVPQPADQERSVRDQFYSTPESRDKH